MTPAPDRRLLAGLVQAEHLLRALHQYWPADACRDAHLILTGQPPASTPEER
jgi:hypothetical protein